MTIPHARTNGETIQLDVPDHTGQFAEAARPVSLLRGTKDYGQVLHQIRTLLVLSCTFLAAILLLLAALYDLVKTPGRAWLPTNTPSAVTLSVPGPDPAADYYAHVRYADGTERDVQLGAHLMDRPISIEFAVNAAPESQTSCRIVIDGVIEAEQVAYAGGTAKCKWGES